MEIKKWLWCRIFGDGRQEQKKIQVAVTLLCLGNIRHVGRNPRVPSGVL